jgi:hypothetical protein
MSAMKKSNGERGLLGISLFVFEWVVTALLPVLFKKSLVFHFSIDSLQNLTILLFTPTNSIDFYTQLRGTLFLLLLLLNTGLLTAGVTGLNPKNGKAERRKNYMTVSCLPKIYKPITSVISKRMEKGISDKKLMPEGQKV